MSDRNLNEVRDEAFRKIGRNLVMFQKMEKALKTIVSRSKISGVASQIEQAQKKRNKAVEQRTMGGLVTDFMDSVHSEVSLNKEPPDDLTEPWVSFSFRIGSEKEETSARKEALNLVVAERNALVHQMLSTFDDSSAESCQEFIELLDEQHDRVAPQYDYVMRILGGMKTIRKKVANHLKSEGILPAEDNGIAR